MPRKSSSHLKLHTEDSTARLAEELASMGKLDIQDLVSVFADATGWVPRPIQGTPHQRELAAEGVVLPLRTRVELVCSDPIDGLLDAGIGAGKTGHITSETEAWALLEQVDALIQKLKEAETTIELQEAQLATSLGVSIRPEEAELLAERLKESLQRACEQTVSDAAAIYLLDDTTSELKMRAAIGLSSDALTQPPRQLRGALADLEALMGNAVLVENTKLAPEWNCPQDFAAALCLPIGSPTMPQGTIWLWSDHIRDFTSSDIEVARAASDKILVDIERSVLADEVLRTRATRRQIEEASMVQSSRLPSRQPLHHDYEISGWTFQGQALGGNFHTWTVNKNQEICVALGAAVSHGPSGSLIATSVQTVVETCWNARHKPSQVLRKANDILWDVEDGDWRSSLCYVQIHPESGAAEIALTGDTQAFILTAHGVRRLNGTPTPIAEQPDTRFYNEHVNLEGGELLILASADVLGGLERGGFSQDGLLEVVTEMQEESVEEIADHIARLLPMSGVDKQPLDSDRSLVVLRRRF
ncbi:MAG: SpoIIE family protein phosphatase [Planctomycetota bacterium]|nr:SpoIIE family protein phosphatase [Planctomycetota bacterium]